MKREVSGFFIVLHKALNYVSVTLSSQVRIILLVHPQITNWPQRALQSVQHTTLYILTPLIWIGKAVQKQRKNNN